MTHDFTFKTSIHNDMLAAKDRFVANCRGVAGFLPTVDSPENTTRLSACLTECYRFTQKEKSYIVNSLNEFIRSKCIDQYPIEESLFQVKCDWQDTLLLIIKARLMQLTFHVSPVCVHGGDAMFQRQYAIAQERDEKLMDAKTRECVRDVVANVAQVPFHSQLLQDFQNMHVTSMHYLRWNQRSTFDRILSYYEACYGDDAHCARAGSL